MKEYTLLHIANGVLLSGNIVETVYWASHGTESSRLIAGGVGIGAGLVNAALIYRREKQERDPSPTARERHLLELQKNFFREVTLEAMQANVIFHPDEAFSRLPDRQQGWDRLDWCGDIIRRACTDGAYEGELAHMQRVVYAPATHGSGIRGDVQLFRTSGLPLVKGAVDIVGISFDNDEQKTAQLGVGYTRGKYHIYELLTVQQPLDHEPRTMSYALVQELQFWGSSVHWDISRVSMQDDGSAVSISNSTAGHDIAPKKEPDHEFALDGWRRAQALADLCIGPDRHHWMADL